MRTDPAGSRLTAREREPRIVIGIIYPFGSIYVTNRANSIANVPGNVIHGSLEDVEASSQELSPDDARATIGGLSFSVVDLEGALTAELREQLTDFDNGLGHREIRVFTGDTDNFTDGTWRRVETYVIDSTVEYDKGSYRFTCSDIQRELRQRVFTQATTRLTADLTDSATTLQVRSTAGFDLLEHTAAFTDAPSETVGYVRIKKTGEVVRYTGKTDTTFTGCTRAVFRTRAQAVDFDEAEVDEDRWPEIEEVIYLEMPAPQLKYAVMTGTVLGTSIQLPADWNLGIPAAFVDAAMHSAIGTDLFDPNDHTAGLVLSFSSTRGLKETDGKRFCEEQLDVPMRTFAPISPEGKLGLRRRVRRLSDAAPTTILYDDNIVSQGALINRMSDVVNRAIVRWNHDGEDLARESVLVNNRSISVHGLGQTKEIDLLGLTVQRNNVPTLRGIFNAIIDQCGAPPQEMELELSSSMNRLEVGDVARVVAGGIRDYAGLAHLDRSFEIRSKRMNWRTGALGVRVVGSTAAPDPDQPEDDGVPLDDAWYSSAGVPLSSVLTIVDDHVTVDGNLAGNEDLRNAVYYHLGDLTIDPGVTVTANLNTQLRIRGAFTDNGKIDGVGRGLAPIGDPNTVDHPLSGGFGPTVQTVGSTRGSDGIWWSSGSGEHLAFSSRPVTGIGAVPRFNLSVVSGELIGIPAELRGTPGIWGVGVLDGGSLIVRALGGAGGASGAGLMIVCRGLAFGVSGEIDLSGADGSAPSSSVTLGGKQVYGGAGGGGAAGGLVVVLDGNDVLLPDLTDAFIAHYGATPQTGNPIERAPPDGPAEPWTGSSPGIGSLDTRQSSRMVQWALEEVTGESADEATPTPRNLTAATEDGIGVRLTWDLPAASRIDFVELFESIDNDRANAVMIYRGLASSFAVNSDATVTRYYWIRARDDKTGPSEFVPASPTGGVSATFGGASFPPWTAVLSNVSRSGSTFVKTGGADGAWDAEFHSQEGYVACAIGWRAGQTNLDVAVGLDSSPASAHDHASLNFAIHCEADGTCNVSVSGSVVADGGSYTTADQFQISYDGLRVRFYKSGALLHTVGAIGLRLFADSSFWGLGAAVNLVTFGPITHVLANATGWAADSQGKPSGVRQGWSSASTPDRSTLTLVNGALRIAATSAPTGSEYCLPAIPVDPSKTYQLTVRHGGTIASADGRYFRFEEYNAALPAGKTHIGNPGGSYESVFVGSTSSKDAVSNAAISTTAATDTFSYTPTAGTKFMSLAFWNFQPNTTTELIIEWAALTELGSNVDLLPGVLPPVDTFGLNPESATSTYSESLSSVSGIANLAPQEILQAESSGPEVAGAVVFATVTLDATTTGGTINVSGQWFLRQLINGSGPSLGASENQTLAFDPATDGNVIRHRVVMQIQFAVVAGDEWEVELWAQSAASAHMAGSSIKIEVNVIRR